MTDPIIVPNPQNHTPDQPPIAATGTSFEVHEWSGSGPAYLHVHYADDEAWHILAGTLTVRFRDRQAQRSSFLRECRIPIWRRMARRAIS